jgi:hypothetical protein
LSVPGIQTGRELALAQDNQWTVPEASALPFQQFDLTVTEVQLCLPPAIIGNAAPLLERAVQQAFQNCHPDLQFVRVLKF